MPPAPVRGQEGGASAAPVERCGEPRGQPPPNRSRTARPFAHRRPTGRNARPESPARCPAGGPAEGHAPDSTRFFSPASARSMMTFSALRLIIPSIGIFTSTVSE